VTNCRIILTEHGGNAEAPTTGRAGVGLIERVASAHEQA
jgi:hypothetical protein